MPRKGPAQKLDELGIVDDFGALRDRREIRARAASISPWASHQAERATPGAGRKLETGDAGAEAFGLALAGIEREPDGDGAIGRLRGREIRATAAGESSAA